MQKVPFQEQLRIEMDTELVNKACALKQLLKRARAEYPKDTIIVLFKELAAKSEKALKNIGSLSIREVAKEIIAIDDRLADLRSRLMNLLDNPPQLAETATEEEVEPHH